MIKAINYIIEAYIQIQMDKNTLNSKRWEFVSFA